MTGACSQVRTITAKRDYGYCVMVIGKSYNQCAEGDIPYAYALVDATTEQQLSTWMISESSNPVRMARSIENISPVRTSKTRT